MWLGYRCDCCGNHVYDQNSTFCSDRCANFGTPEKRRQFEKEQERLLRLRTMPSDFPLHPEHLSRLLLERWRAVGRVESRTCRGTGFLIGQDLFLTNNHVIPSPDAAAGCQVDFHLERYPPGVLGPVGEGIGPLPGGWFHTSPSNRNALDYTVFQLSYAPEGVTPIRLTTKTPVVGSRPIMIGHPRGRLKEINTTMNIVQRCDEIRVNYTVTTEPGSSGSPIIDDDLEIIAVHTAEYVGIRTSAILHDLRERAPWIYDRINASAC